MNIIIPLAGNGQRFKDDGYMLPKPLIKVLGSPLCFPAIGYLKPKEEDRIYLVYLEDLDDYGFSDIVHKTFPGVKFIKLKHSTRGPVETVLCALNRLNKEDLLSPIMVVDGDTFYNEDIIQMAKLHEFLDAVFYFETKNESPIYSYIKTIDGTLMVKEIREKEKISDKACSGAYLFSDGWWLKGYCEKVLSGVPSKNNEYYISDIYSRMLKDSVTIGSIKVSDFECIGTPHQLKTCCVSNAGESAYKRFCFDLDGTLCTFPKIPGDYSTVLPIFKTIKKLRYLKSLGHTIIIQTARGMGSSEQNTGMALAKTYKDVFAFLEREKIPFDEIYFGKPQADFYIDDLAVSPFGDLDKDLGFYEVYSEPRNFNKVKINDVWTTKETNNPGEVFWYQNIPMEIADLFPVPNTSCIWVEKLSIGSIMIETIKGIPLSYLLVNGSLTNADIDLLWDTMERIHGVKASDQPALQDIKANYIPKLLDRWGRKEPQPVYFYDLETAIEKHKPEPRVIHGDPVMSNIFLCANRKLKFIDMRGKVGSLLSIIGDVHYDWAKIYQSLCGYDHIVAKVRPNREYIKGLQEYFLNKYSERYGNEQAAILPYLTACLLFSLRGVHEDFPELAVLAESIIKKQ